MSKKTITKKKPDKKPDAWNRLITSEVFDRFIQIWDWRASKNEWGSWRSTQTNRQS